MAATELASRQTDYRREMRRGFGVSTVAATRNGAAINIKVAKRAFARRASRQLKSRGI